MRNLVVDTNVLVRAFFKREGSDGILLQTIIEDRLQLWYSIGLLDELLRVLSYKRLVRYGATKNAAQAFIQTLIVHGKATIPLVTTACRDPDDNEILGVAMAVAENSPVVLVSADKDILVLKGSVEGVHIMTPQEFLRTS